MKEIKEQKISNISNIIYILKLLWKAKPLRVIATLFRVITEHIFYVFFAVYLTQYIFTAIETQAKYSSLIAMITFACCLHIGIHIMSAWYTYYISRNDPKIYKVIFDRIITKAKDIPLVRFEQPDFYDKFTRALDEAIDRAFAALDSTARFLAGAISAICTMFLIIRVDSMLLLFVILPVISSIVVGRISSNLWYEMGIEKTRHNRIATYTKRVFYEKKYAGEIRLYNIKEILFKKHRDAFNELYKIDVKYRKRLAVYSFINNMVSNIVMLIGYLTYIIFCVTSKEGILVAPYIAMINAVGFMSGNIQWAAGEFIDLLKQGAFIQNLRDFLEYKPNKTNTKSIPITKPVNEIELQNVYFTYAGTEKPVINGISLKIHKGEKIAFVGHNGAGKTTIVKLLMGLYDVTDGNIIAGENNIRDYEKDEYYKHFGVVFQDFQIFALPLAHNVLMKNPETAEERNKVIEALQKAQFGDKLSTLPNGINTMVTKEFEENGMGLSGGEAQKIAIARVFAKDCDIAILDEPSSALDPIAEFNMYNNMMEIAENKTVIFISHRLSSARMADKIYMLEQGRIIEQGTHNELIALNEKYAEMYNLQAKNYREDEVFAVE